MTEINYWLMKSEPVVIAMDFKNHINSVHTPSALFAIDSRSNIEYVLGVYYNGVDNFGNQIEESSREESFERRWNRARAILLKSK